MDLKSNCPKTFMTNQKVSIANPDKEELGRLALPFVKKFVARRRRERILLSFM